MEEEDQTSLITKTLEKLGSSSWLAFNQTEASEYVCTRHTGIRIVRILFFPAVDGNIQEDKYICPQCVCEGISMHLEFSQYNIMRKELAMDGVVVHPLYNQLWSVYHKGSDDDLLKALNLHGMDVNMKSRTTHTRDGCSILYHVCSDTFVHGFNHNRKVAMFLLDHPDTDLYIENGPKKENILYFACRHECIELFTEVLGRIFISHPKFPFKQDYSRKPMFLRLQFNLMYASAKQLKRLSRRSLFVKYMTPDLLSVLTDMLFIRL